MKKTIILFGLLAFIVMSGCKKDETTGDTTVDNKDMINEIFKAGMAWNAKVKEVKSIVPINIQVDNTVTGTEGGTIHVLGSITGSMNIDDKTGAVLGGTMLLGLTETINDYTFVSNGQTYTMNGAPYISLTGTFTLLPGGTTFGTASSMQIGGGVQVSGPNYNQTVNIQLTININSNGTGGNVSGTINGVSVNYSF